MALFHFVPQRGHGIAREIVWGWGGLSLSVFGEGGAKRRVGCPSPSSGRVAQSAGWGAKSPAVERAPPRPSPKTGRESRIALRPSMSRCLRPNTRPRGGGESLLL